MMFRKIAVFAFNHFPVCTAALYLYNILIPFPREPVIGEFDIDNWYKSNWKHHFAIIVGWIEACLLFWYHIFEMDDYHPVLFLAI